MESDRSNDWTKADWIALGGLCVLPLVMPYLASVSDKGFHETNQAVYQTLWDEYNRLDDIPMQGLFP